MLAENTLELVSIFHKINKKDQLLEHYHKCRLVLLDQFWDTFKTHKTATPNGTISTAN